MYKSIGATDNVRKVVITESAGNSRLAVFNNNSRCLAFFYNEETLRIVKSIALSRALLYPIILACNKVCNNDNSVLISCMCAVVSSAGVVKIKYNAVKNCCIVLRIYLSELCRTCGKRCLFICPNTGYNDVTVDGNNTCLIPA